MTSEGCEFDPRGGLLGYFFSNQVNQSRFGLLDPMTHVTLVKCDKSGRGCEYRRVRTFKLTVMSKYTMRTRMQVRM